jgi:hypothetical protein
VIDSSSSSSGEDLDDRKTMNMINSTDPFLKLMIIGKINSKIKSMIQKPMLNEIDLKLLKGIFLKNP